jgi:hypothetical protein
VQSFQVSGLDPAHKLRLVVRAAPTEPVQLDVSVDGSKVGQLKLEPSGGWVESSLDHLRVKGSRVELRLGPSNHEWVAHHVFVIQEP